VNLRKKLDRFAVRLVPTKTGISWTAIAVRIERVLVFGFWVYLDFARLVCLFV